MPEQIHNISLDSLIYPLFVKQGNGVREPISSLPGIFRFSLDTIIEEVEFLKQNGINRILLFGIPDKKDSLGSAAYSDDNVISETVTLIKKEFPEIIIFTDVCLCAYALHGHCAVLDQSDNSLSIDKKQTLSTLARMALSHAAAGADFVAPSAMAKEQVGTIRNALDKNSYNNTKIMGYSAKFASQFYGPFREIVDSAPKFSDRSSYQLNYSSSDSALSEVADDIKEGADIVMVKPALAYLDVIRQVRNKFNHPIAAYNVSGEYAMVKAGVKSGYWDEKEIVFEIINSIKRAGADIIITYHALDIAKWFKKEQVLV